MRKSKKNRKKFEEFLKNQNQEFEEFCERVAHAESWLEDVAELDNEGDALAVKTLQILTLSRCYDDPDVSEEDRAHARAWLKDYCDPSNEGDALAYLHFTEWVLG